MIPNLDCNYTFIITIQIWFNVINEITNIVLYEYINKCIAYSYFRVRMSQFTEIAITRWDVSLFVKGEEISSPNWILKERVFDATSDLVRFYPTQKLVSLIIDILSSEILINWNDMYINWILIFNLYTYIYIFN